MVQIININKEVILKKIKVNLFKLKLIFFISLNDIINEEKIIRRYTNKVIKVKIIKLNLKK